MGDRGADGHNECFRFFAFLVEVLVVGQMLFLTKQKVRQLPLY